MFDWEDLRHFAALAREASLSAAARRLGVDHATVARRIVALEAALGLRLVDRRPRSYALTPDGTRIAALAARMETEAFAVDRAARAKTSGLAGEVAVSAPPLVASALIAPRLGELRARHPEIRLRLIGEKRSASLSRREADLALRLSRPVEQSLVARRIGTLSFALYGAPDYLARHDAADYEFIGYDENLEQVPQQQWLRAVASGRAIVLRSDDIAAHQAAARAGVGLAALPRFLGDSDGSLATVEVKGKAVAREVWLAVHRDLRAAPAVRAVMDFLAGCVSR